jgi:ERCC4-related helicase
VKKFRAGELNVLVATSIGEEGLDIGEVDLIVCFDVSTDSRALIQRMGRTGRKREGRCVILCTEGQSLSGINTEARARCR